MVGQAYHAGVLAALQIDLGWDARDADIVLGTSAGALTGTMLRVGASPFDLASWVLGRPWSPEQTLLDGLDALRDGLPLIQLRTLLRPWHIPALGTWIPIGGRPRAFRPLAMLASMLPEGQTEMQGLIDLHLTEWTERAWPDGLWVCAVQRKDGARIVFGREPGEPTDLSLAVAASTAIPGYFAPVTVEGRQLLDGGLHSPTNADLLGPERLDLAIIVSPMSGGGGWLDRKIRHFAQRRVRSEIKYLEEAGTKVILFEPGPTTSRAMGLNPMAVERAGPVLQSAFFESGAVAARPDVRRLLGSIANFHSGRYTSSGSGRGGG